jgi:tetratricopeptide (TPR) repeat protein
VPHRPLKYNPAFLSQEELIDSFVVRHEDLDLIVRVVRDNVTSSNQHVLVIGPRGMGKTMLVLRVAAEVRRDPELSARWYPLVFAEESYQVSTPGEFWLEAIFHLARQTGDARWQRAHDELKQERDEQRLRERALAQLLEFADDQAKRVVLIVENLNMLLCDQLSDDDAWVLRHTLVNEPRLMLLASATARFHAVENADQAMFDLFKLHELKPLDEAGCRAIWAATTGQEPRDGRIRPIQILTGGNPRLLVITALFGADLSFHELMEDLTRLVDDHTEYFKSHLDHLAPTERKVYLSLAEIWDPATAREVAEAARLEVSGTSSLLGRLVDRGAVCVARQEGRTKWYQVAERMYNIYYLMRRRGAPSDRVRALVNFMVSFYAPEGLRCVAQRIAEEACALDPGRRSDHYLAYAGIAKHPAARSLLTQILSATRPDFFDAPDTPPEIQDLARDRELLLQTRPELASGTCTPAESSNEPEISEQVANLIERADDLCKTPEGLDELRRLCLRAVDCPPYRPEVRFLVLRAFLITDPPLLSGQDEDEYEEAASRRVIEPRSMSAAGWMWLGITLDYVERHDEAEAALRKAIELDPTSAVGWALLGDFFHVLKRHDEAVASLRKAIELNPKEAYWWYFLGDRLCEAGQASDAMEVASTIVRDTRVVQRGVDETINLFAELAALDCATDALRILEASPSKGLLEPLVVALRMYVGEQVTAPTEIVEVAKDVVQRIEQRRQELQSRAEGQTTNPVR